MSNQDETMPLAGEPSVQPNPDYVPGADINPPGIPEVVTTPVPVDDLVTLPFTPPEIPAETPVETPVVDPVPPVVDSASTNEVANLETSETLETTKETATETETPIKTPKTPEEPKAEAKKDPTKILVRNKRHAATPGNVLSWVHEFLGKVKRITLDEEDTKVMRNHPNSLKLLNADGTKFVGIPVELNAKESALWSE